MRYEIATHQNVGRRADQQDVAGSGIPSEDNAKHAGLLGVLSDGMGGLSHGLGAAVTVVDTFKAAYARKTPQETPAVALARALLAAHEAVQAFAGQVSGEGLTGATVVAAVLLGDDLYWISAGDSRAYLLRNGRAYRLTVDHNYGEDHRLTGGPPDPNVSSAALTSFMGMPGVPTRVDQSIRPLRLQAGDCVLLASDGLHDALTDEQIAEGIARDLEGGCRHLVQMALAQDVPDQDNVTVLAMRSLSPEKQLPLPKR